MSLESFYHESQEFEPITVDAVRDALDQTGSRPRKDGDGYRAICPAHNGANGHNLAVHPKQGGGVLITCHSRNCTYQDVLKSIGLWHEHREADCSCDRGTLNDGGTAPMPEPISSARYSDGDNEVYVYQDATGKEIYQNLRMPGKKFLQRRVKVDGSFEWKLGGVLRVPYGLPELCKPEYRHMVVHICEGEKDAIRLRSMGFLAISFADGALREPNLEFLKGRHVLIHEDNDEPGRAKSSRIVEWLHPTVASTRVMRYTSLPEKSDVSDWWDQGGTVPEFLDLIADLPDETRIEDPFEWPEFEPLDVPYGPEFNPSLLPRDLRMFVEAVAASLQVPLDMVVTVALGAISAVVGGQYTLHRWHEPVHGMFVGVARPGLRKSALLNLLTKVIVQWQANCQASDRLAIAEWESTERSLTKARDRLEGEPRKGDSFGSDRELNRRAAVQELNEHLANKPVLTLVMTDDATPQAVGWSLIEQRGRLAIVSPEASYLENIAGRFSDGPDLNVYLHGHAADALHIHRRGGQSGFVERACLTLCLAVQMHVIERMGEVSGFMERGGAARLLMALPRDNAGYRLTGKGVPELPSSLLMWWEKSLRRLLESRANGSGTTELSMTAEAIAAVDAFERVVESRYPVLGIDDVMRSWISKQVGAALRIAGLLHVMLEDPTVPLDHTTMQHGIAISEWYRQHAEVAFNLMQGSSNDDARTVRTALLDFGAPSVNRSDLQQKLRGRNAFKRAKALNTPLRILEDSGYVRTRKVTTGERGRPVEWVDLNPLAVSKSHAENTGKYLETSVSGITSISRTFPNDTRIELDALESTGTDGFTPLVVGEI